MGFAFPSPAPSTAYYGGGGYYFDDVGTFGNWNIYVMRRTMTLTWPKNWRWFDVFRLWLARIPCGFIPACPMLPLAIARVRTASSVAQMRRQKRKLGLQGRRPT